MKQILLLTTVGMLAASLVACTQDERVASNRPHKTYTAVDAPLGSHVRRVYTDTDAPPAGGVSSTGGAGERPFYSSASGGARTVGGGF